MDGEFGFTLGVLVSFLVGVLLWPTSSKEEKRFLSILSVVVIVVHVAHEMLK